MEPQKGHGEKKRCAFVRSRKNYVRSHTAFLSFLNSVYVKSALQCCLLSVCTPEDFCVLCPSSIKTWCPCLSVHGIKMMACKTKKITSCSTEYSTQLYPVHTFILRLPPFSDFSVTFPAQMSMFFSSRVLDEPVFMPAV